MKKNLALLLLLVISLSCWTPSVFAKANPTQQRIFAEGMDRLKSQNYLLAENLLIQFLMDARKDDVNRAEALLGLGVASLKNGKLEQAAKTLLILQEGYESSKWANEGLYWRALCRYMQEDFATSKVIFDEFLALPPFPSESEGAKKNELQRWDAFVYRGWSLYRTNDFESALAGIKEGLKQGLPLDYNFSLFTLTTGLALKLQQLAFMDAELGKASFENFELNQKRAMWFYQAELKLALEGPEVAYPYYQKVVDNEIGELSWQNQFVQLSWKRLFKIEEDKKDWDSLNLSVGRMIELAGYQDELLKPILLRMVALNLENREIDALFTISIPYLEANPLDFKMWNYHVEAVKETRGGTIEEILPDSVLTELIQGEAPREYGDFLWARRLSELADAKDWETCKAEAERMLTLYPKTQFYWQALYCSVYSSMNHRFFPEALDRLNLDKKFNSEIAKFAAEREQNPLWQIEEPNVARLYILKAYLEKSVQDYASAVKTFSFLVEPYLLTEEVRAYNPNQPIEKLSDEQLRLIYNTGVVAFQAKDFVLLRRIYQHYLNLTPNKDSESLYLLDYYSALSYIAEKNYQEAQKYLIPLEKNLAKKAEFKFLHPWCLYYLGWSFYREGNYDESYKHFRRVRKPYPNFEKNQEVQRLLAWSAISAGNYLVAANEFLIFAEKERGDEKDFAIFQAGRSYDLGKNYKKGKEQLLPLSEKVKSPYGDDALMELASGALNEGEFEEASRYYLQMQERYPQSPMLEEASFMAAESLFMGGKFKEAIDLYAAYKRNWPRGYNYQAALYRGAVASTKIADYQGAKFLYSRLYQQFGKGPYEAETIIGLAEVATALGEWSEAMDWYRQLQDKFPVEGKAIQVAQRLKSLFFRTQGRNNEEAKLLVELEEGGGVSTRRGRKAALQLANLYINLYRSPENRNAALGWLNEIVKMTEKAPKDAVVAYHYLGDDAFREGKLQKAIDAYLAGATLSEDKGEIGSLLYKAIQVTLDLGAFEDAIRIFGVMEERVGDSDWYRKAAELPALKRVLDNQKVEEGVNVE